MAFLSYRNTALRGVTACVPPFVEKVIDYEYFTADEALKFTSSTGVVERHIVKNSGITSSDLCYQAAERLLEGLGWEGDSIEGLIFISQSRDYILPSTSCILQARLGLPQECYTVDIPYGCSGFIYGLQMAASLVQNGELKRVLLLVGDAITPHHNIQDKSSYPLFGDAGTATAIEYESFMSSIDSDSAELVKNQGNIFFHFGTDGRGAKAIIIPDGGYRNRISEKSFELKDYGKEGKRRDIDASLSGMDIFSFGIDRPPKSVKALCERYGLNISSADYFLMHQANRFLNEKIRKKLKIEEGKTPYSIDVFGNTSCATIPLTMCHNISEELESKRLELLLNAFGVGLSWGSAWLSTDKIYCKKPFIYEL